MTCSNKRRDSRALHRALLVVALALCSFRCAAIDVDCATSDVVCNPVLLTVRGLISAGTPAKTVPSGLSDALYAWYPLDGNLSDLSGNAHHGFLPGGPWPVSTGITYTTNRTGVATEAASFNGVDQLFASNFAPVCNQDFTVALWIFSGVAMSNRIMGTQTTPAQNPGVQLQIGSAGQFQFTAFWVAGGANTDGIQGLSPATIPVSEWTHLAYVHNGASRHGNLWVNGVTVAGTANFGAFVGCTTGAGANSWWVGTPFNIGYSYPAAFYSGKMEDIWFYQGRQLTADEIAILMGVP